MGVSVNLSDAPFRDVQHALNSSYRAEAVAIVKISSTFADLRGTTVRAGESITAHDKLAQASFTRSLMLKSLPETMRDVIEAYYTVPEGIALEGRKENACAHVSWNIWEDMGEIPNRAYLWDVTRGWASPMFRRHQDRWWAEHLNVTERTLRGWRNGSKEREGALRILDSLKDAAISRLSEIFRDGGVCE